MTATIVKEEAEAESTALTLRSSIDSLEVIDQQSYDLANDFNLKAYQAKKAFHTFDDPVHDPLTESWRASCARRKKVDDACDYTIKATGSKQSAWMRAEQAKAAAWKRQVEEALLKEAEDAQIRAAEALQKDGLFAAADEVMEAAPVIARVVVATPDKADGVYYQDRWSAEVVDLMALVKSVACGESSIAFLQPCEPSLGSFARSMKGTVPIPGVRFLNTPSQGRRG